MDTVMGGEGGTGRSGGPLRFNKLRVGKRTGRDAEYFVSKMGKIH